MANSLQGNTRDTNPWRTHLSGVRHITEETFQGCKTYLRNTQETHNLGKYFPPLVRKQSLQYRDPLFAS